MNELYLLYQISPDPANQKPNHQQTSSKTKSLSDILKTLENMGREIKSLQKEVKTLLGPPPPTPPVENKSLAQIKIDLGLTKKERWILDAIAELKIATSKEIMEKSRVASNTTFHQATKKLKPYIKIIRKGNRENCRTFYQWILAPPKTFVGAL